MRKDKPVLVVSAFIKDNEKYLLVYDTKFESWRVPGGRPNYGERIEDALRREMKEELGIEINIKKFLGFGQDIVRLVKLGYDASRFVVYYECTIKEGKLNPKKGSKISDFKWLTLDEIRKHKALEPAMKDYFSSF